MDRGSALRLLPWATPDGRPCFLSTDDDAGLLSSLADAVEEEQMRDGAVALTEAEAVLDDPAAGSLTLRLALKRTGGALGDVLRIADSRGGRLPVPCDDPGPTGANGPVPGGSAP
ncbi:hypothetical protein HOY81_08265 [Streptomyces sp. JJ36]|nr:hypothetical protein [Streptomyces sp. JJ36]